jgi:type I restriction enzyme, S subunit
MDLSTFFQKFDQFADAPDAVAKLRELVLELAVRGQLSERQPKDQNDPAWRAFVDEIDNRIYGSDPGPLPPFNIPEEWRWVIMTEAADCRAAAKVDSASLNDSDWVLDLEDIDGGAGKVIATATFAERRSLSTKASFQKGDVLYGKLRPYLNKVVLADRPGFCTTEIIPLRPQPFVAAGYLRIFLRSSHFLRYAAAKNYGMKMPRLGTKDLESAGIPLPPLAEQKRIVAKVDELMALCDRLEAQQQERETRHAALARASLSRFAEAPTPANLEWIFHPSYTIPPADLRKAILTLAVQGKLVPQDPNDEPAGELLERLARELTPEQRRRQADPLAPLPAESLQYELPYSWTWARFRDVAIIASNLVKPDAFLNFTHLAPDNIEKGNGVLLPCRTVREDKVISSNHRFCPGQIVYSKIRPNLAKVVIVDFEGLCSADMYPIDALIDASYLQRYMLSEPFLVQAVKTDTRVAMPKINQLELNAIAVPVPPLAEQRRIVAKVDQLMALVDALEQQLAAGRATAANLLSALVAELTFAGPTTEPESELMAAEDPAPYHA